MKKEILKIAEFLQHVDAFCARMNGGLAAVAVVLLILVVLMSILRSSEIMAAWTGMTAPDAPISTDTPVPTGWTYN